MKKEDVIIFTSTYYPSDSSTDKIRAELALLTLKKSKDEGYDMIFVDGGSKESFLSDIKNKGGILIKQSEKGLGNARRQGFREAYSKNKKIILWTEPEKHDLIKSIPLIAKPLWERKVDLIVPKRKSMESYPLAQQLLEPFANLFWKELTGTDLDIWVGARALRREVASYFINYFSEYDDKWDLLNMPLIDMIKDKRIIKSVEIDYEYDFRQTEDEEHNLEMFKKRIEQLSTLINIEDYWKKKSIVKI